MGSKYTNAQAIASPSSMSQGIASAFGDDGPEAQARKRKEAEDAAAASQAQQATGQVPSAWDTMKGMAGDVASGLQDVAGNPSNAWDTMIMGKKKK